jgi:pimeloyl-ACP methyl ester carboxylesterase
MHLRICIWWLSIIALSIVCIVLLLILSFRIRTMLQESKSTTAAAPSTGRFVQSADVRVFIQETGPSLGEPIIFIHGVGSWGGLWQETTAFFAAKGYRTITVDLPPFGFSERPLDATYSRANQAERIIGVLDALHLPQAIFVGHSFGAGPTVEAAIRNPKRVKALIIVDGALGVDEEKSEKTKSSTIQHLLSIQPLRNGIVASTLTNPLLTKSIFQSFLAKKEAATPERIKVLQQPMVVKGSTNAVGTWLYTFLAVPEKGKSVIGKNYAKLSMPVLLLWGDADTVTPPEQAYYLKSIIPYSNLVMLHAAGHIPQIEAVEEFNNSLFLFTEQYKAVTN